MSKVYETVTPLDLNNRSIVIYFGHRCRVSNFRRLPATRFGSASGGDVARYELFSDPSEDFPKRLPPTYEGGTYGGNEKARVLLEYDNSHESEEPPYGGVRN